MKDRRKRQVLTEYGKKKVYLLRRMYCQKCKKLHLELPDFMIPHKWYEAEAIEAVLTGKDEACPICTRTKKRWKKWYESVKGKIDALCQSLLLQKGIRLQDVSKLAEMTKVLGRLKLAAMLIINSGEKIPT